MKRVRLLGVAGVIAATLPFGMTSAGAATESGSQNSVTINSRADYDFVGTTIDVGLNVRCYGGSGEVLVQLDQYPPETPYPVGTGSGPQTVVCDGKSRSVGVTVGGFGFDEGKALAKATLVAPTGTAKATKWINIVVV